MIRKALIIATLALLVNVCPVTVGAQRLSDDQVRQALTEMREFKHRMLVKELGLQKDQEQKFFDIYDKMDDELMTMGAEMRELERKTLANESASDTECETVARALFEQKKKEADVELRYYEDMSKVLTPRQMLKLKSAERKISITLANYHGRQKHRPRK